MRLELIRKQYREGSTVGHLLVDGTFECFTLEDGVRKNKVFGETAIPPGHYRVTIEPSKAFNRDLPRLHNVPGFEGILIHVGNEPKNTHGCILVGAQWTAGQERIGGSKLAFDPLFAKIGEALGRGEAVTIDVVQEGAPADLLARSVRPPAKAKPAPKPVAKKPAGKKSATRKSQSKSKPKRATKPKPRGAGRSTRRR